MSIFTEEQRNELERIIARNTPIQTKSFEDINPKKLSNAKAAFGNRIKPDEEVFLQYDDTVFGSAREGILMTEVGMHTKGTIQPRRFIPYEQIESMGKSSFSTFTINLKDSETIKLDANHDTRKIFALVSELVDYMQKNFSNSPSRPSQTGLSASVQFQCPGCGAPTPLQGNFCEYCGRVLQG